jgi:hypothetical protein
MNVSSLSHVRGRTRCRFCGGALQPFVDLGVSPPCESFLTEQDLDGGEAFYPLDVKICDGCWLAQLGEFVPPERIFGEYAYFSSFSKAWLEHAARYCSAMRERFALGRDSFVLEVASNDGYLLRNFVASAVPCLGVEPAANVAKAAIEAGVPTEVAFFGRAYAETLAASGRRADLIAGNNVLAQVPDLNDFVAGLAIALKDEGALTLEFPHLLKLMAENQFDTIYHEHFSYFSLTTVAKIFAAHGLRVFDVEELWTHGGSLRVFGCRLGAAHRESPRVGALLRKEEEAGLTRISTYASFNRQVVETKWSLLDLLIGLKRKGKRIVGYGAPGKGNTLLNYCGVRADILDFTVDRNPYKHGRYLPGTRIPIYAPERLDAARPDYVLILPWNLREEIVGQLAHIRGWGGRFIVPIPTPAIVE